MIVLEPGQLEKTKEVVVEGPYGVHDTLREGIKSIAHDLAPKHPLQTHLKTAMEDDENRRRILSANVSGASLPFRMSMEKLIVNQTRLGGLPSSNLSREILNGQDEDIDVPDFLNLPHWSPDSICGSLLN